jgi:hypothetical protein
MKIKEEQQSGKVENDWRNRSNEAGIGNSRCEAQTVNMKKGGGGTGTVGIKQEQGTE